MSRSEAIARAGELRESLLDHGVRQVSIELVEGRGSGGWSDDRFVATLGHHIVSRRSQGLTPFLALVKRGRVDLPGPICNGYGGFDEVARIICMGWANHPGQGGPVEVEAGIIPENNGRPYLFGWEFEGGIDAADWTPSFREFMGRCHAGTLDWLGRTEKSHHEHKTWARPIGRKTDRLGYSLEGARAEAARYLEGATDLMAFLPLRRSENRRSDVAYVATLLRAGYGVDLPTDGTWPAEMTSLLREIAGDPGNLDGTMVTGQMMGDIHLRAGGGGGTVPRHEHTIKTLIVE